MKAEIPPLVVDVSGQPAKPAAPKPKPKRCADKGDQHPGHHQDFSQFMHVVTLATNPSVIKNY